jgi:hypothetical protein
LRASRAKSLPPVAGVTRQIATRSARARGDKNEPCRRTTRYTGIGFVCSWWEIVHGDHARDDTQTLSAHALGAAEAREANTKTSAFICRVA